MSTSQMIVVAIFLNVFVLISCQTGSARHKEQRGDADAIVFPDSFETLRLPSRTSLSQSHLMQPQSRIANSDIRRSRPKSDQTSTIERRRKNGPRMETIINPLNEYARNKNYERTSISSTYESGRRINSGSSSSITFPSGYPRYSGSHRRPSHTRNDPSQLQKNEDNLEGKPMVPTGQVPYSYLYKWIKQYHKNPK